MKARRKFVPGRLSLVLGLLFFVGGLISSWIATRHIDRATFSQARQKLEVALESRASWVEDYFRTYQEQTRTLSGIAVISESLLGFSEAFRALPVERIDETLIEEELLAYQNQVFVGLDPVAPHEVLPRSPHGRLAQWIYLVQNPNAIGDKRLLYESSFESEFETVHRTFHRQLESLLQSFDFRDLFLIAADGLVVYSVEKELDFGTNAFLGPFSRTGLGTAARAAAGLEAGEVFLTDFGRYVPSSGEAAAFLAAPVVRDGRRMGSIVLQLDVEKLNEMIADFRGLGESGETYIVGSDRRMRTQSRFSEESTVLRTTVDTEPVGRVFRGHRGTMQALDYRGVPVLSNFRPLEIAGLSWVMLAEVDTKELRAPGRRLARVVLSILLLTLLMIGLTSIVTIRFLVQRPVSELVRAASDGAEGNYASRARVDTNDEFGLIAHNYNRMAEAMETQIKQLEDTLAEVKELKGLLPICASCKSIRDDDGFFRTVETYLVGKSHLEFSHTMCLDCMTRLYPELSDSLEPF